LIPSTANLAFSATTGSQFSRIHVLLNPFANSLRLAACSFALSIVNTLWRGKMVSLSYQPFFMKRALKLWICLKPSRSDTESSVGEMRTTLPYLLCRSSTKKMRRPPTTAFLSGRLVKRDQNGPGMFLREEVNARKSVYLGQISIIKGYALGHFT
jgi:hypothetical protein